MNKILYNLTLKDLTFPHPDNALAEPNGLLAVGGDLSCQRLINAYKAGIFPWFNEDDPYLWWSPDPRAVIDIDELNINRSLKKFINKTDYQVTVNKNFIAVIMQCADAPFRNDDTWILDDMITAYIELHNAGFAHSVEVWQNEQLVGGLYGVAVGGSFSGESMFYRQRNASKIALIALARLLKSHGIKYIDCQIQNPFLQSMGSKEIPRAEFLICKHKDVLKPLSANFWQTRQLDYR